MMHGVCITNRLKEPKVYLLTLVIDKSYNENRKIHYDMVEES